VIGQDIDYFSAIHSDPEDLSLGVYTAFISPQPEASSLSITGKDGCTYKITADLSLVKENLEEGESSIMTSLKSKELPDVYESVGGFKDPHSKNFSNPRLFVIRNDGSGYELLAKE
jgi:hypothetical protein